LKELSALLHVARHHITELRENDAAVLCVQTQHSIGLFYFCKSLQGLQYLNKLYSTQQLQVMMQDIFISLLDSAETIDLRIDSLRWDQSNYTDCRQQLYTFTNLPIVSRVYGMAEQNQRRISMCDVRSLPIDELPFELIEIILIQATGHLFVTINRTTPARAKVYTLATMMAVSHFWWNALSYRKYVKRLLKRSFKRVCHPFKCSPQHVFSLHIEGGNNIWGVAVFNDELYVACGGSNIIQVFDSSPPFSRREDI
jgi:hypothetical protein